MITAERNLQTEIMLRLNRFPVVAVPVPNGAWLPARNEQERVLVARIVNRLKADGQLTPGSPDLILLGEKGAICCELKRPASRDLFGRKPRGRLSPEQKVFRDRCVAAGVEYLVADCWEKVECHLYQLF